MQVEDELKKAIENRKDAGVVTKGEYQLRIDNLKKERLKLLAEIEEEKSRFKTPKEIKIFFYVLVSTNEKVREHIGDVCHCLFHCDCYHDNKAEQWKPFADSPVMEELLRYATESYGIQPIYLDGDIEEIHWINFDKYIDESIAVIDLFSLDSKNKLIAYKFDTGRAGVLMPLCRSLKPELIDFAKGVAVEFKALKSYLQNDIPCSCYAGDISSVDNFKQELLKILIQKFPIKNQTKTESRVRELNIGF